MNVEDKMRLYVEIPQFITPHRREFYIREMYYYFLLHKKSKRELNNRLFEKKNIEPRIGKIFHNLR